MNCQYFGTCDTCGTAVGSHYQSLSRNVERYQYENPDAVSPESSTTVILHSERLTQYCKADCAAIGVYNQLSDRGISFAAVGNGPIEPCSKCARPINLAQANVAYELMDQTEIRQPWLLSVETHDSEIVARQCSDCDGVLTHDFMGDVTDIDQDEQVSTSTTGLQLIPEKCKF